ncbi:MAG TPA: HAD family hydrolase [Pirellulales bacterium]|jgi:phosphoglycolate phosphatase-like HAD superfamily hydrolase|nr:HAD family hydrolase [Pirellulales bacterium]
MHLVMFDIDGTLTQSDEVDSDCYAQAVAEVLNLPPIDRDWSRYQHVTESGIAREIIATHFGRQPIPGELERIKGRFVELLHEALCADPNSCSPIPGALSMLSAVSARDDLTIALATGGWEQSAQLKLRSAGFNVETIAFASADDSTQREQIMLIAHVRALERCGREAFDSVIYVGDGLWDLQASRRLCIPFIAVANGDHARKLRAHGAQFILPDFRDCGRFLEMLQSVQSAHRGR